MATVVAGVALGSAAYGATALRADFESGGLTGWSYSANATVSSTSAHDGSRGVRVVSTETAPGYLAWGSGRVTQGHRYARISGWVRIAAARSGENVGVFSLKNANGYHHFDLWRDAGSGRWRYDLYQSNSASAGTATVGQWYFLEALVDFGGPNGTAYAAQVRVNGVTQPAIRSTGQVGTTVRSAWFGANDNARRRNTRDYDALAVDVGSSPFGFTR